MKRTFKFKTTVFAQEPNSETVERVQQSTATPSLQAILWFLPSSLTLLMSLGVLSVAAFSFTCYSLISLNGHVPFFTISVLKSHQTSLCPIALCILVPALTSWDGHAYAQLSCVDIEEESSS